MNALPSASHTQFTALPNGNVLENSAKKLFTHVFFLPALSFSKSTIASQYHGVRLLVRHL
jgi:hypothetical protein